MLRLKQSNLGRGNHAELEKFLFGNLAFGELFGNRAEQLGDLHDQRVLEVGYGDGAASVWFAKQGATVTAIDKRSSLIEPAQSLAITHGVASSCHFQQGQAESTGFSDNSFDVVFSQSTLQYTDRDTAIEEYLRVLRPGGRLVLIENLRLNPVILCLRMVRRLSARSDRDLAYLGSIRGYISLREVKCLSERLADSGFETRFLFQITTLLVRRSNIFPDWKAVRALDRLLERIDSLVFRLLPCSGSLAWIASAWGVKRGSTGDQP